MNRFAQYILGKEIKQRFGSGKNNSKNRRYEMYQPFGGCKLHHESNPRIPKQIKTTQTTPKKLNDK